MQVGEEVLFFVCDAEDAYWQVPLHPKERQFYCSILTMSDGRKRYLVYMRTPQGSVGAPLSWSQEFGLISRCVSGVLRCPTVPGSHRKQVYVDDPIITMRGPPEVTRRMAALAVLSWLVLGVALALKKAN